jgi:hypothetical protein
VSDQLLDSVRRWFEIIEVQLIDPDSFSAFEVWLHAQKVIDLASAGKDLPNAALSVLTEIGERLGVAVGSPPAVLGNALEQHFGQCPYGQEVLDLLTRYLRSQINAFKDPVARKGPDLSGDEKPGAETYRWPEKKLW